MDRIRKRTYEIIQIGNRYDFPSRAFDWMISILIVGSILATFLHTFDELGAWGPLFDGIEIVAIVIFSIEYLLRLWTARYMYEGRKPLVAALMFMISFYGIIDFVTIASYYMPVFFSSGFVALRMLRVVRIMRLFKLNASYDAFNVITDVLKERKNQLFSSMCLISIMILASSLCMYNLEHEVQPDNFQNAFSGIWWSVSTLLTVGYGDIYPMTVAGRIMAIFISFLGVGLVAVPTGIISAGFVEHYSRVKTGVFHKRQVDFITMDIDAGHEYIGKNVVDIKLPKGLYLAAIIRDNQITIPYPDLVIEENDYLFLGSESAVMFDGNIEEMTLESDHIWVGQQIRDLDISRQTFFLMIKRGDTTVRPEGDTVLEANDTIILLNRIQGRREN